MSRDPWGLPHVILTLALEVPQEVNQPLAPLPTNSL